MQKSASEFANDSGLPLIDSSQMSDDEIHSKFVSPYIKALSDMMKRRFDDNTTKMCLLRQYSIPLIFPQVIPHMVPLNYQIWHLYIQLCPLMMYRMNGKHFEISSKCSHLSK